jgi:hypothetical protein
MFNGNTSGGSSVTIANGGSVSNKDFTGNIQSASVVCNGACTVDHVRINSNEGVRVGGSGTVRINQSWLETNGVGEDHADTIQAYSPGSRGTLWVTNSTIRAHVSGENGGIGSVGVFIADNWTGNVTFDNVIIWGGQYGIRVFPDTGGDNNISFNNVYFVGPFGFGDRQLTSDVGGHTNHITQWTNVRNATVVNGVLVPGSLIATP